MNSFAKIVEIGLMNEPENKILEASSLYKKMFSSIPEASYYKTLERMCKKGDLVHLTKGIYYRPKRTRFGIVPISESEIVNHYTKQGQGIVVGYKLYNRARITTQISKRIDVLSSSISEQKKTVGNVRVSKIGMNLTKEVVPVIEALEILQNQKNIEDFNTAALIAYMESFASNYSDKAAIHVLENRKYKKSTIAYLERFLNHFKVENSLNQFLSAVSEYKTPEIEGLYESS